MIHRDHMIKSLAPIQHLLLIDLMTEQLHRRPHKISFCLNTRLMAIFLYIFTEATSEPFDEQHTKERALIMQQSSCGVDVELLAG